MQVKLISITESLIEEKKLTPEELIVYVARVSNPSNQLNTESSEKLLKYMVNNKHWSPFEMCDMTIEIKTSRGIAAQILRHRSFSFQEFSQRYSEIAEFESIETRKAGATNRQSSSEPFDPIIYDTKASELIANHVKASEKLYKQLLTAGVAKECARFVLPFNTQSTIYMKGSIRSWIHYLQIRCDENTQKEHQEIAGSILEIFRQNFPTIASAVFD